VSEELRTELLELARAARELLAFEGDLGGEGLPAVEPNRARPIAGSIEPVPAPPTSVAAPRAPGLPPQTIEAPSAVPVASVSLAPAPAVAPGAAGEKIVRLQQLAEQAATCTACVLHSQRRQAVFARGNADAELVFVGEGPGQEEDRKGQPFVGPAGQLLDRMIAAMGFERDAVYICNVVKCRPPDNRTPRPEEAIACAQFLVPQLELVAPKAIVALGRCAAENLGVAEAMGPWRGRWGEWRGIPVLPTYHPAYLLRSPEQKRVVWEDLQLVMKRFGWQAPPKAAR
jgi:uracil-DNA glycosylase